MISHEAPESHHHGFREIGDLARAMGVKIVLHGHHHRPVNAALAHTIASIGPSVAHQVEFELDDDPGYWNLEPAAYQILVTLPGDGIIAHTVYVENFPGPFPFVLDPDYPGVDEGDD